LPLFQNRPKSLQCKIGKIWELGAEPLCCFKPLGDKGRLNIFLIDKLKEKAYRYNPSKTERVKLKAF
jgi:hypothetical protein